VGCGLQVVRRVAVTSERAEFNFSWASRILHIITHCEIESPTITMNNINVNSENLDLPSIVMFCSARRI